MDTSSVSLLNYGLQFQWCSDSDLSSLSSPETLSPVPSMDSSLSPSYQQPDPRSTPTAARNIYSQKSSPRSPPGRGRRTGRIRSKQRESASEKEKLRMRDLTKALHHLRSYLPPSVAPAGQTLTKIETLRLAIRYISYLSAQLGLSEEVLFQRRERVDASAGSSPDILSLIQSGSDGSGPGAPDLYQLHHYSQHALMHSGDCGFGVGQQAAQTDPGSSPAATLPPCQIGGKDFCTPLVPREYWG